MQVIHPLLRLALPGGRTDADLLHDGIGGHGAAHDQADVLVERILQARERQLEAELLEGHVSGAVEGAAAIDVVEVVLVG